MALVAAPRLAVAQGAPGPALPMGMDIRKAAIGAWSEYAVTLEGIPPFKQRFSLVGRDAATHSVEMASEGGTMGPAGKVVIKVILETDPAKRDRVRKLIMQLADNDPMEMKQEPGAQTKQFAPLNPRKLIGKQTVTVPAGSFATKHYRDKSGDDGQVDVWVSDEAPPFGIVKLQGSVSQGPGGPGHPITMELAARGQDAKPAVTKPAQPFDQGVLMGQMRRSIGNGAPAGPGKAQDKAQAKGQEKGKPK